ncbi:hypothetical protein ACHAXR_001014, partial [Thalassiosira sp. AJA248-18]
MAAKAAIQRQWNLFLKSEKVRASTNQWAASMAILVSAAVAVSKLDDDSSEHSSVNLVAIETLLPPRTHRVTQCSCEGLYQRLSKRPNNGAAAFGPWQSVTSARSRKSLLHRQPNHGKERDMDMNEKYDIDFNTVLGEGAYGRVHPARLVETGENVALKKISKQYTNSTSFSSETDALLRIYDNGGHPNISGLRDMYDIGNHYYLILDLARGGEMFDHLIQHGQYSEFDASRLVTEILSALAFLHNIGVVHADLKPENILLCSRKKGAET